MKPRGFAAGLVAGVLGICALSQNASAASVSIFSDDPNALPAVGSIGLIPFPNASNGTPLMNITGPSNSGVYRSPFEDFTTHAIPVAYLNVPFSSIGSSGPYPATATFNFNSPLSTFTLLWGSPDSYNIISFWSGTNGTGTFLGSFAGDAATLIHGGTGFGHDLVTFQATGATIGSILLQDNGQAAFEFADPGETPIPAALPLFATGLGVVGFLARRRKQRMAHSAIAAV